MYTPTPRGDGVPYASAEDYPGVNEPNPNHGFNGADGGAAGQGGDAGSGSVAGKAGNAGTPGDGGARGHWGEKFGVFLQYVRIHYGSAGDKGSEKSNGTAGGDRPVADRVMAKTASRIYMLTNASTTRLALSSETLVSIGSEKEQNLIKEMLNIDGTFEKNSSFWMGLTWDTTENYWVLDDGNYFITPSELDSNTSNGKYVFGNSYDRFDELAFDNWFDGEPTNDSNDGNVDETWLLAECQSKFNSKWLYYRNGNYHKNK